MRHAASQTRKLVSDLELLVVRLAMTHEYVNTCFKAARKMFLLVAMKSGEIRHQKAGEINRLTDTQILTLLVFVLSMNL